MGMEQTSLLEKIKGNRFLTSDDRQNILDTIDNLDIELHEARKQTKQLSEQYKNFKTLSKHFINHCPKDKATKK